MSVWILPDATKSRRVAGQKNPGSADRTPGRARPGKIRVGQNPHATHALQRRFHARRFTHRNLRQGHPIRLWPSGLRQHILLGRSPTRHLSQPDEHRQTGTGAAPEIPACTVGHNIGRM